jgi:hypothetical protein
LNFNENVFNGFFGWWICGVVFVKLNKNKEYSPISRVKHVWLKSFLLFVSSFLGMNYYFGWSSSQFARKNVAVVDTIVETHLKFI